ncbi:MBL fold metallo-hydrolase [Paenibacillus sp. alder61]|uniref:MBL fold metallo-hydrolase n=1 Tax=Paenibacillus faecis TaxID=862114 RepID=A0A5D0CTL4_9BACL|nr:MULTISPECIES: MBL fold metallo-hydrolase [Paenibacillus]MCA1295112.1 MBL fold metallo-hydrolase [Paenibacillus sp. alder61]TYA13068.1 MBL fold metallo-hydrolase [Paenibacillus faecis]
MPLRLQMLGTGSAFAKKYYNNNAILYAEDYTLLIDCGITAPLSLHQLDKSLDEIDGILITHIHGDHVGGLEEFAFRMKFIWGRKPVLYIADKLVHPLWEHTLKGGLTQEGIASLEDAFEVKVLSEGTAHHLSPCLSVELIQTPHIPGKDSYSLYINGETFYSADMIFQRDLLTRLVEERNCRKILHEVQLQGPGQVHTELKQLLSLPAEIRRIILLMHYGDEMENFIGQTEEMEFLRQHQIYTL